MTETIEARNADGIPEVVIVVTPARYAKRMMAVQCVPDGSGFKTRAARLACALPSRYSGREKAYIMSNRAAQRLTQLYLDGWDADTMTREFFNDAQRAESASLAGE